MGNIINEADRFTVIPSVYLLFTRDNKVLLLRRANTGYMDGQYNLVAGHLEPGESASEGAAREGQEETGATIDPSSVQLVHTGHRVNRGRIDLFFRISEWQGEITNAEPDVCDDLSWFAQDALPENTVAYVRFVLDAMAQGLVYSEYTEQIN